MKWTLTLTDATPDEILGVLAVLSPDGPGMPDNQALPSTEEAASPGTPVPLAIVPRKRGRPLKSTITPAPLPAAPSAPVTVAHPGLVLPVPEAAPVAAAAAAPEPVPVAVAQPAPVMDGAITMEELVGKARALGTGAFKQMGLLAVLTAMGAPSLPKIPTVQYPAFGALLDAALAYSATPGASYDYLKGVCVAGQYDAATRDLLAAANAAMGL